MKLLRQLFSFFVILIACPESYGQSSRECGTEASLEHVEFISDLRDKEMRSLHLREEIQIPVAIHIITNNKGKYGIDSLAILKILNELNIRFNQANIFFQPCGDFNYIRNDKYIVFDKVIDEAICVVSDIPGVLNLYFVPKLVESLPEEDKEICGYTYISSAEKNRIIIDNDCALNGSTLAHEVGHYFSLLHTHEIINGRELVNRSNCKWAGDGICDTPADPVLNNLYVNNACQYVAGHVIADENGDKYDPDPENIMSYAPSRCRSKFSDEQISQLRNAAINFRSYLKCEEISTSTVDLNEIFTYRVYPNPSAFFVIFLLRFDADAINLYSMSGQNILHLRPSSREEVIDVSDISNGIYIYTIHTKDSDSERNYN